MKQVLLDLQDGKISVENIPIPALKKGVIVQNHFSLISAGTESSLINLAGESLIGKARSRPDLFKKVKDAAKRDGILSAYEQAMSRLAKPEPLGYSSAGVVIESNIEEFKVGDRVACAGSGYACHAEYVYIPKNLCVKVSESVPLEDAAFTTVGAIAIQGIRNAKVTLGEKVVVIGLGLIGLLTIQILKSSGCTVLGIDVNEKKITLAKDLGADTIATPDVAADALNTFSEFGADAVIITAATKSNIPIEQAGKFVREKGRVVVVGSVGLHIPREIFYEKEAELVVSRSYGPGRYDREYEEKGFNYPIYVRWTEKRNMQTFVDLLAQNKIRLHKLITHKFPIEQAPKAYDIIREGNEPYIGILLNYDILNTEKPQNIVYLGSNRKNKPKKTITPISSIGFIGGGIQAINALLPNLKKFPVELKGLATTTGISSFSVAKKFGFEYCTTDYKKILNDESIHGVIIATRNDTHAKIAIEAMGAGKRVFVEKPLAINLEELYSISQAWKKTGTNIMVGFNRRYSPDIQKIKEKYLARSSPLVMNYRINAGQIPNAHWVHDSEQGGGMLISEMCHFVDTLQYIAGSNPTQVYAISPQFKKASKYSDNLQVMILFEDGSTGSIVYVTIGDNAYSKEQLEVFGEQSVAMLKDYRELTFVKGGIFSSSKNRMKVDKGIYGEMDAFLKGEVPDFSYSLMTTLTILKIEESLKIRKPIEISNEFYL